MSNRHPVIFWISAIFALIFAIAFLAFGRLAFCYGQKNLDLAEQSLGWPKTTGVVLSSSLNFDKHAKYCPYQAMVSYQFTVRGTRFIGHRLSFEEPDGGGDRLTAQLTVDRYPPNKQVAVYYKPDNPAECVLSPGTAVSTSFASIMGLISLVFGTAMIVSLIFERKRTAFPLQSFFSHLEPVISNRSGHDCKMVCPKCHRDAVMKVEESTRKTVLFSRFVLAISYETTAKCQLCSKYNRYLMPLEKFQKMFSWELTHHGETVVTGPMKCLVVLGVLFIMVPLVGFAFGCFGSSELYVKKTRWKYVAFATLVLSLITTVPAMISILYFFFG